MQLPNVVFFHLPLHMRTSCPPGPSAQGGLIGRQPLDCKLTAVEISSIFYAF